jgi:hypothetical protein
MYSITTALESLFTSEEKEGRNEYLPLHGALYLSSELSCIVLMGNSLCFISLAAYQVLWPCFKAIFLFILRPCFKAIFLFNRTFNKNSINLEITQIFNTGKCIINVQSHKELVIKRGKKCNEINLKHIWLHE